MASNERRDLEKKMEALIMAIPRETAAYEYYTELAKEYEDAPSKEMFTFLAEQELKHKDYLERLLHTLEEKFRQLGK